MKYVIFKNLDLIVFWYNYELYKCTHVQCNLP